MTTLPLRNPRTGADDGTVAAASTRQVAATADRLRAGQHGWLGAGVHARGKHLRSWADRIQDAADAITAALYADTGRRRESRIEVDAVAGLLRQWAATAPELLEPPASRPASVPGFDVQQDFDPYALVGVISPWNFPLLLSLIDTIPALAAGASVLVKPSEVTPRFVAAIEPTLGDLRDVLAFEIGDGATGRDVVDVVDLVCFTGSVATGRRVAVQAAERFIPVSLELGGKDPAVVLPGADLDHAARAILWGATSNAGQACQSIERVYVHVGEHEDLVDRLVAGARELRLTHPDPDDGQIGPIISAAQAQVLERHLADARERGAVARTGGTVQSLGGGLWLEPTVLTGVDHDMLVMREESFGPIIPVMGYADVDEAVRLANDTDYGLSAAVFAATTDEAVRVGLRLRAGAVSVNDAALTAMVYDAEKQSYGSSGMGASRMGPSALARFGRRRALLVNRDATPDPWWWPTTTGADAR